MTSRRSAATVLVAAAILVLGLLLLWSAYGRAYYEIQRDWARALQTNTREGFARYLAKHPTGRHVPDADKKLEVLTWQAAQQLDTAKEYQAYLVRWPTGEFAQAAESRLAELDWDTALNVDSYTGYARFMRTHRGSVDFWKARDRLLPLAEARRRRLLGSLSESPIRLPPDTASAFLGKKWIVVPDTYYLLQFQETVAPGSLSLADSVPTSALAVLSYGYGRGRGLVYAPMGGINTGRASTQELLCWSKWFLDGQLAFRCEASVGLGLGEEVNVWLIEAAAKLRLLQQSPPAVSLGYAIGAAWGPDLPSSIKVSLLGTALGSSRYWSDRLQAAITLGELGDSAAVPTLCTALQDDDDRVRIEAAKALGRLKGPSALECLVGYLRGNACDLVMYNVVGALGELQDQQAIRPLVVLLGRLWTRQATSDMSSVDDGAVDALYKIDPDWWRSAELLAEAPVHSAYWDSTALWFYRFGKDHEGEMKRQATVRGRQMYEEWARRECELFLWMWAKADTNLAQVKDARRRLASLRAGTGPQEGTAH